MQAAVRLCAFALLEFFVCAPLLAADWLTVASDRVRRVELDRASIMPSEAGTKVAWGRIVLSDEQAKAYGYRTVRALNRYDCRSHAFIIVKRVYLSDDESTLREDKVDATLPITVKTGTVDDRFFSEVCKPASVAELRETAQRAAEKIAKANENERPMLRRADIRLTKDEPAPNTQLLPGKPVENKPTKPEDKPALAIIKPEARIVERKATVEPATPAPAIPPTALHKPLETVPRTPVTPPTRNASTEGPVDKTAQLASQQAAERAAARAAQQVAAMTMQRTLARDTAKRQSGAATIADWRAKAAAAAEAEHLHWSYEGPAGPENWGKLDPEFSVCSNGKRQSPIDIRNGIKVDQEPIAFDYKPSYFRIVDNGHTIQVTYGSGSQITVMGRTYDLVQFHFHHPAEERIDGKGFAMVAHLVHRDSEGRLAIVAVLLEAGQANRMIQTLWNNLPLEKNDEYGPRVAIQATELLPAKREYISYIGSLTTPPCTEGVLWLVMKQPVQLAPEQIDVFARFYPNNARPLQAASGRLIKDSR